MGINGQRPPLMLRKKAVQDPILRFIAKNCW